MFPEAGGQYHYLKQAFGPLWGFLFGWTSLLAIQAGPVAYLGVAFGDYLGAFVPFFSSRHVIASIALGPVDVGAEHRAARRGVRDRRVVGRELRRYEAGRRGSGISDAIKLLLVAGLIGFGLSAPAKVSWIGPRRCRQGNLLAAMGLAWWRSSATSTGGTKRRSPAGEIQRPERNLPLGMIGGTALIGLLYLLVNLVYFRAMPLAEVGASARIGEEATTALLGPTAGRLLAAGVLVSIFGCISSAIIGASRLGLPMSQDAPAFRWLARIHPRYRTPTAGILDPRRLVDVAGLVGELRAVVRVLALLELHLPCNYRPGVVHPPTETAGHPTALPGRRLPLGAGAVPGSDDGAGPEYPPGAARPVAARGRDGGARCSVLSVAPTDTRRRKARMIAGERTSRLSGPMTSPRRQGQADRQRQSRHGRPPRRPGHRFG